MGHMNSTDSAGKLTVQTPRTASKQEVCCSSPSSMRYWLAVSVVAWGVLSLIGIYWYPLHASSAVTILLAAAVGCFANWFKNRTLHCGMTGPLFLVGAVLLLPTNMHLLHIEPSLVWPIIVICTGISFVVEWRYSRRPAR